MAVCANEDTAGGTDAAGLDGSNAICIISESWRYMSESDGGGALVRIALGGRTGRCRLIVTTSAGLTIGGVPATGLDGGVLAGSLTARLIPGEPELAQCSVVGAGTLCGGGGLRKYALAAARGVTSNGVDSSSAPQLLLGRQAARPPWQVGHGGSAVSSPGSSKLSLMGRASAASTIVNAPCIGRRQLYSAVHSHTCRQPPPQPHARLKRAASNLFSLPC